MPFLGSEPVRSFLTEPEHGEGDELSQTQGNDSFGFGDGCWVSPNIVRDQGIDTSREGVDPFDVGVSSQHLLDLRRLSPVVSKDLNLLWIFERQEALVHLLGIQVPDIEILMDIGSVNVLPEFFFSDLGAIV